MLKSAAPFPFNDSFGFLVPDLPGEDVQPVRIIRRNPDDTALVALQQSRSNPRAGIDASGNCTVATSRLVETEGEALERAGPKKRRRAKANA